MTRLRPRMCALLALALLAPGAWSAPLPDPGAGVGEAEPGTSMPSAAPPTREQLRRVDAGGLYSLSGVMEAGSQLLLHADGRFEWMLAYGAMDQAAHGRWRRDGDRVRLTAEVPKRVGAVFVTQPSQPWDEESESQLREGALRVAEEALLARCPFLHGHDDYASAAAPFDMTPPTREVLDRAATDAERAARAATVTLEQAAAAAMAAQSAGDGALADAAMTRARSAMEDYKGVMLVLGAAFEAAGRDVPALPPPVYPQACAQPPETADELPALPWQGGHAVVVGDPRRDLYFSGIAVAFEFSDGQRIDAVTNRSGWAGVARHADSALATIELALRGGSRPVERFTIGSRDSRLYPYAIDSAGFEAPAFETMKLRIDGDDLVPTWPDGDERGRYSHD